MIIGMLLKLLGIVLAIPNTFRTYKHWKDKESAKLWEINSIYALRGGRKIQIGKWKRIAYRVSKMPNPHLWEK